MAEVLKVSESGYYLWKKRQNRPKTEKEKERETLIEKILEIYLNSNCIYGARKITSELNKTRDNAPMESFWGKLKQEWLYDQHFRTREEAKKAVFEYIWIFYNNQRIHEKNDYMTPSQYYAKAA